MFGIKQDELVANLRKIANWLCGYNGKPCDCKFMPHADVVLQRWSESYCGCPEINQALLMLAAMDEKDYKLLCYKAGVM